MSNHVSSVTARGFARPSGPMAAEEPPGPRGSTCRYSTNLLSRKLVRFKLTAEISTNCGLSK